MDSITRKLKILRLEQSAIKEEIDINDELGSAVSGRVEQLAKSNEVDKFKLHVEEVEKITSLLLGLSGRLARAQNALMTLSADCNPEERVSFHDIQNFRAVFSQRGSRVTKQFCLILAISRSEAEQIVRPTRGGQKTEGEHRSAQRASFKLSPQIFVFRGIRGLRPFHKNESKTTDGFARN